MGHARSGKPSCTKSWREVVRLIADGADVGRVADATIQASERAFACVQGDPGFKEAVWLMTQLAIAANKQDPAAHLAFAGIELSPNTSLAEVAVSLADALDRKIDESGRRSDFGEMAQRALVGTVSGFLEQKLPRLLAPTAEDVNVALRKLSRKREFGDLSREFFAKLTHECLEYFLSRTLATHLGAGQRLATMNQQAQFEQALERHCYEASAIVEGCSGAWFSKHRFEEAGESCRKSSEGFGWFALEKMRRELAMRGKYE